MPFPSTHFSSNIHSFKAQGKLLLTGEYFVLDGALALALPTKLGQQLNIQKDEHTTHRLHWKSLTADGHCWFEGRFDLSNLNLIDSNNQEVGKRLQQILEQAKTLNPNFLEFPSGRSLKVETYLEFPRQWGLGSSSTLLSNIASWAQVDAYQLLAQSFGGSGYDLACAEAKGPIFFQKKAGKNEIDPCPFSPPFRDQLYFVYLEQKQNSREGIARYRSKTKIVDQQHIDFISGLSQKCSDANDLAIF
ncbi:MAG: GYDIA family GHMP kinase, partial [Bacteroidota bacterium]